MSLTLSLIPVGIALCATANQKISEIIEKNKNMGNHHFMIETNFVDSEILKETLVEHGYCVEHREDGILLRTSSALLHYQFNEVRGAYDLSVNEIVDVKEFMEELEMFEKEYGVNIQTRTYKNIMDNLEKQNLSVVSEQILEDDSILLRIEIF